jgi:hypothetical protein
MSAILFPPIAASGSLRKIKRDSHRAGQFVFVFLSPLQGAKSLVINQVFGVGGDRSISNSFSLGGGLRRFAFLFGFRA